jgi:hypothetical protein
VDTSLSSLRSRLFDFRSWDTTGETLNRRVREALNLALDRLAGDVPEALIPSEEHIVLNPEVKTGSVSAYLKPLSTDKRIMQFVNVSGAGIDTTGSGVTWRPTIDGTWDGLMHIEFDDGTRKYRRQSQEFWTAPDPGENGKTAYYVTLDRPWKDVETTVLTFRLHQPEFFVTDDVMQVLEPARIFDDTRQQVWAIDTAGAYRQDMVDFHGEVTGRPYRCWRGRHFQIPAPTEAPVIASIQAPKGGKDNHNGVVPAEYQWGAGGVTGADDALQTGGQWGICYTYVIGRRDQEWQQGPMVAPGGHEVQNSTFNVTWAYESNGSAPSTHAQYTGVNDPLWESAPSPVKLFDHTKAPTAKDLGAMVLSATNIDAMLGFGNATYPRYGKSGVRIRYYVAQISKKGNSHEYVAVETNNRYYFLCEVEPTYDQLSGLSTVESPDTNPAARVVWDGTQLYDYHRPLKHSTGYFAWKVYPHQDARYELDFRVLRLPRKFIDDRDTAPIQRDAVPCLLELSMHYMCLIDGADQVGAQAHMSRYTDLVKTYRKRYANPGHVVEPVPLLGYSFRHRYGSFKVSD